MSQRPTRLGFPRRSGCFLQASRVSASNRSAGNFPSLSSAIPIAYSVRPESSDSGSRPKSRHFWTAEGQRLKRLAIGVSPIWSIALATMLCMAASLHRKCKLTIDRKRKARVSHFRHAKGATADILGSTGGVEPGRRLALRFVGHRARARHLAFSRAEVERRLRTARPAQYDPAGYKSRRQYGVAKNRARP